VIRLIFTRPTTCWEELSRNIPTTTRKFFFSYTIFVAAIPALAVMLRNLLWPLYVDQKMSLETGALLLEGEFFAIEYGKTLGLILLISFLFRLLIRKIPVLRSKANAPEMNRVHALIMYSFTPYLFSRVFILVPPIAALNFLAGLLSFLLLVYSFFLFYKGMPVMLEIQGNKRLVLLPIFLVMSCLLIVVVNILVMILVMLPYGKGPPGFRVW